MKVLVCVSIVLSISSVTCHSTTDGVSVQMMDSLNAPLVATLNISKLNEQLTKYIDEVVEQRINEATEKSSETLPDRVQKIIKNYSDNSLYVGFTVCVGKDDRTQITGGDPIIFTLDRSSYGTDVSEIRKTGKYTIEVPGLYLVSASIRSETDHAYYAIYDNDYKIVYGYTAEHDKKGEYIHSGSIQCVRSFDKGDIMSVRPWKTIDVDAWSCLTLVKIK